MATSAWPFWKTIPRFDREYNLGDLVQALATLAGNRDADVTWLKRFVSPPATVHLARSGRECLYLILKILGLPANSRVGVPLYCCASVFEAIVAAGHIPVFLDIDLGTYALCEDHLCRNRTRIDALVVVHTFGYPSDLNRLRQCLGSREIPIIEDCAHALFSEYQGRPAGTSAEASFFTFGMHKPAAAGGGAVLLINDPALAKAAARERAGLQANTWTSQFRHSFTCWARSLSYHRAVYGALLGSPLRRYRDEERGDSNGNGTHSLDQHFPPRVVRRVDQVLIRKRLEDFHLKLPALAANTQKLREAITGTSLAMPSEPSYGKWNHFLLPVRYQSARHREFARNFLMRQRIDTAPLYKNCARKARHFGYAGGCHHAEQAAEMLCTVPHHPWLSDEEIAYIGESLRLSLEPASRGLRSNESISERVLG